MASQYPTTYDEVIREKIGKDFKELTGLDEQYDYLNGLTFDQLDEDNQNAFKAYCMACTIIPYGTPKEEVFPVYEDINSGGEDLTAQQLRRVVYSGEYIQLLDELVHTDDFQFIRDPKSFRLGTYQVCPKDSDRELILRAFAWKSNYAQFRRPSKTFFNTELKHYEDLNGGKRKQEYLETHKAELLWAMRIIRNVCGDMAFRNPQQPSGISPARWDALYSALCELRLEYPSELAYIQNKAALRDSIAGVLADQDIWERVISTERFIQRRKLLLNSIRDVIRQDASTPNPTTSRSYSSERRLKQALFERQNGLCSICQQSIDPERLFDGSYVHSDHVHAFSKGGLSTEDNCGLAHAACNRHKSAK